jgi:EAL domain-containing protein (putative c-di-GMP-specific phosphodiesterase class I)
MSDSMNLNVIAEGVETESQRQFLSEENCTHYQGYLFGRPVPIDEFEKLLKPD